MYSHPCVCNSVRSIPQRIALFQAGFIATSCWRPTFEAPKLLPSDKTDTASLHTFQGRMLHQRATRLQIPDVQLTMSRKPDKAYKERKTPGARGLLHS